MNFNPEKGGQRTLFGAGTYAGSNWHEYDIAATGGTSNNDYVCGRAVAAARFAGHSCRCC